MKICGDSVVEIFDGDWPVCTKKLLGWFWLEWSHCKIYGSFFGMQRKKFVFGNMNIQL